MSSDGVGSMHDHPFWKFAAEVNTRCETYFTGPTALWFLEWKEKGSMPSWSPDVLHLGIFGSKLDEMAAFAFVAGASHTMKEHKELMYVRVFETNDFMVWLALKGDPMDIIDGFNVSWARLGMFVNKEFVIESKDRESSVISGIGSWRMLKHFDGTRQDEYLANDKKEWESRPYEMNWEPKEVEESRVYVPVQRSVWAEWMSPTPTRKPEWSCLPKSQ